MLGWFVGRWQVEVTSAELRPSGRHSNVLRTPESLARFAHLGMETQRQWSDLAIARTAPAPLGLLSLAALWMDDLVKAKRIAPQATAWCRKTRLTFTDAIAAARREIWLHQTSAPSRSSPDSVKVSTHIWSGMETAVAHAR